MPTRKMRLDLEIEIDVPTDIVNDEQRFNSVKEGIIRCISRGLYEQGVSFKIMKSNLSRE